MILSAEQHSELLSNAQKLSSLMKQYSDGKQWTNNPILNNAKYSFDKGNFYIFVTNGAILNTEREELLKTFQNIFTPHVHKINVYQAPEQGQKDISSMIQLRITKLENSAKKEDFWPQEKLFTLTGTNKNNDLVIFQQQSKANDKINQLQREQAIIHNDLKTKTKVNVMDQKHAKKVIDNLSADVQLDFHYRTPLLKQLALLAQTYIKAYNKKKHEDGSIEDFSVAVNFSMSNRQYKQEYGHRKNKGNGFHLNAMYEEPVISSSTNNTQSAEETNKQKVVSSTEQTTSSENSNDEDNEIVVQILHGMGLNDNQYHISVDTLNNVVTLNIDVPLNYMKQVQNIFQQNMIALSPFYTKGNPELGFDFEVNELKNIPTSATTNNIAVQPKSNNVNSQSTIKEKPTKTITEKPIVKEKPIKSTTKETTIEEKSTKPVIEKPINEETNLWNNMPDEEDMANDNFNMVAGSEQIQQIQEQLNIIAQNNNQNVQIKVSYKNNNLVLLLQTNDTESILNYYQKYKEQLIHTIHQKFPAVTFNNLIFENETLTEKQNKENTEMIQIINQILQQNMMGLKSYDLTYQYNILRANYGSTFKLNIHLLNVELNGNKITKLKKAFKEQLDGLENIRINSIKEPLNNSNLKTETVHILKSPAADIVNNNDFFDFELNSKFKLDLLSSNPITDVSNLDFKHHIDSKRNDPLQTYIFKFEGEDTPADSFTDRKNRKWDKMIFIASDDNNIPFKVSLFGSWEDKMNKKLNKLSKGDMLAAQGKFGYDKFQKANVLSIQSLQLLSKAHVQDNSNKNGRYELHSHSKMSQLSSINNSNELINKAVENGFGGIAFTDDTSSQAYPKLIDAQGKFKEFKPIFGTELNMITNKPTFVYNPNDLNFVDPNVTYVAFDIETTGFALRYNDIIELSMVKYKPIKKVVERGKNKGKVSYELEEIDHDRQLVKTEREIPQAVLNLTKITQEDLRLNGISIKDALQHFLDFINNDKTILIGHNVHFDIDFINQKLKENNINYQIDKNEEVLDTLTIARRFVPNKRAYNLTALSKNLKVHLEQAHTAVYDAQATGFVWMALYNLINNDTDTPIHNGNDLVKLEENNEHAYQEGFANTFSALAINQKGIKNIYRMISIASTKHFYREAKLYPFEIKQNHENVLLGSGGYNSLFWKYAYEKTVKKAKNFAKEMQFDYLEVAPFEAYGLPEGQRDSYEDTVKQILRIGEELNIPVVAITDTHQLSNDHFDNLAYEVLVSKDKLPTNLNHTPFYTTKELFEKFSFLDKITAQHIIVDNTVKIANKIQDNLKPIVTDVTPPHIKGADQQLREQTMKRAYELYGNPLPSEIQKRVETELNFIIKGGYAVHYIVAQKVVQESTKMGYLVGSRGSVGSSIVAFLMGITEVNALPAHYRSKHGDYFEWTPQYADGWDLPPKEDPNHPGEMLIRDGHNIPFSTFLGLKGTKVPDIDLNTSPEVQGKLQLFLKDYFGAEHTIRVGTIEGIAQKTALAYVHDYMDSRQTTLTKAEQELLSYKLLNVKRGTGQHPAGIMIVPDDKDILDYTPYNYPANRKGPWITTHYVAKDMHDALLKMDVLGHGDPSVLHMLQQLTGVDPHKIDVSDPKIIQLFTNNDVDGLPEFDTPFARGILEIAKPTKFSDLVQISGLSHGTNVWEGNAKDLIEKQGKTLTDVIGNRDKIVLDLLKHHLDIEIADGISKVVKKGKPLKPEVVQAMRDHDVPEWYIDSLKKISYLYPKAHAVAYVMSALRIAYFKVYYPIQFYATIMTYRPDGFDIPTLCSNDIKTVKDKIEYYTEKANDYERREASDKPKAASLRMALHALEHGAKFIMPSLKYSDATQWIIDPNNSHNIIVPLEAMDGFGIGAAQSAVNYRKAHNGELPTDVKIVKDKKQGMGLNKGVLTRLEKMGLIKIHTEYKEAYTKTGKKKKNPDKIETITYY